MSRITGLIAILIGFFISATGMGALIGIPLITIGFVLLVPELFAAVIILGIIALGLVLI